MDLMVMRRPPAPEPEADDMGGFLVALKLGAVGTGKGNLRPVWTMDLEREGKADGFENLTLSSLVYWISVQLIC